MDVDRRRFLGGWGAAVTGVAAPFALTGYTFPADRARPVADPPDTGGHTDHADHADHERFMWLAIEQARGNPYYPFGAVIVRSRTGEVLAGGFNASADNPMLHGEVVAMNDYLARHGNEGWEESTLYTTGEPCSMCMSAMVWAGLPRVVWASSVEEIRRTGIGQISLSARQVAAAARSLYTPELLLGGVLADRTNRLFEEAERLREESTASATASPSGG
ncbi:nucleoside deaminase [Streptomyces sp. NPDC002643]